MNEPERQIMSILGEAVEYRSSEDRAAFLEKACAGDADRRARVEALLQAYEAAGNFLQGDAPLRAPVATVDEADREQSGTVIGPYKLIEQIGEGGMGTVWMAQQTEPVKRLVAVKLIKAGMDSKQVIARFEAERQALALMDHANIARVLDAGTTDAGRPYFVMDLVKGVPITKYCDEHHLTPRLRLELFIPVCQAIQHAHQKGIIHRDLKPSNVLIALYDGKPVPKVIDFGVAKAAGQSLTDKTLVTGFGAIVGTLEYMSPEQAEINQIDIDTRSDIYSLGVLLYELLAGSPPFSRKELEKAGMLEMLRVIREQEPSQPSTKLSSSDALRTLSANRGTEPAKLTRLIRGELDWIVMKALEKDRSRRYETANGFAADVQRYLADEPVQACPPSAGYRLRKFARRNKVAIVTTGAIGGALLIGTVVSTRQSVVATRARNAESRQRQLAEGNMSLAFDALERIYLRVVEEELPRHPDRLESYRQVLSDALGFYTKFAAKNEGSREARSQLAVALARAGNIQRLLMNRAAAVEHLERSRDLIAELRRENPDEALYRAQLVPVLAQLGVLQEETGKWREAEQFYESALQAGEGLPSTPDWDQQLVQVQLRRSGLFRKLGRLDQAEQADRQAVDVCRTALAASPSPRWRQLSAHCELSRASSLTDRGRHQEANELFNEAIAGLQELTREFPNSSAYAESLVRAKLSQSLVLLSLRRVADSKKAAEDAIRIAERLAREYPVNLNYQTLLLKLQVNRTGSTDTAAILRESNALERLVARALQMADRFPEAPDRLMDLAQICNNVGVHEEQSGQWARAEATYLNGLKATERLVKDFPLVREYRETHISLIRNLGDVRGLQDKKDLAEVAYQQACQESMSAMVAFPDAPTHRIDAAESHSRLAKHLRRTGRAREASEVQGEVIAILDALVREKPAMEEAKHHLASAHLNLGNYLFDLKKYPEALNGFARSEQLGRELVLATREKNADYRNLVAHAALNRGDLLRTSGQHADSEKAYREAIRLQEKLLADFPNDPSRQSALLNVIEHLGVLLHKTNRLAEGLPEINRGIEVGEQVVKSFPRMPTYKNQLVTLLFGRAGMHILAKEYPAALKLTIRTLELAEQLSSDFPQNRNHAQGRDLLLNNLVMLSSQTGDTALQLQGLERYLVLHPDDPSARNEMAWFLATTSNSSLRDPKRACVLAEQAVQKAPDNADYHGTLGTAWFRAGDMDRAIKSLEHSAKLRADDELSVGYNQLFLAMAYHRSGDMAKAKESLTRGEKAVNNLAAKNVEQHGPPLKALLTESSGVLGKPMK